MLTKYSAEPGAFGLYRHYFNKFYNPMSQAWKEPAHDKTEAALKWGGRAAMGVGAAAGAAAGGTAGLAAMSPSTKFMVGAGVPAAYGAGRSYMNTVNTLKSIAGQK